MQRGRYVAILHTIFFWGHHSGSLFNRRNLSSSIKQYREKNMLRINDDGSESSKKKARIDNDVDTQASALPDNTQTKKLKVDVQQVVKPTAPTPVTKPAAAPAPKSATSAAVTKATAPKPTNNAVPPIPQQGFFMRAEVNVQDFAAIRAYTDQHGFGAKKSPLKRGLSAEHFRAHYYDKNELMDFCREIGIATTGLKEDLNQRVELFLRTGTITRTAPAPKRSGTPDSELGLSLNRVVNHYKSDPATRAFFEKYIPDFTGFKAKILKWIKEQQSANKVFTYGDIIQEYKDLASGKKNDGNHKVAYESCEMNQFYSDYSADNAKKPHKVADAWVLVRDAAGPKTYTQYKNKIAEIAALLKNPQAVATASAAKQKQ